MKIISFVFSLSFFLTGLFPQNKIDSLFTEAEVELKTPTGVISGTLTIPNNAKISSIVIIIAGSGPTDRNCNSPLGIQTNAYKMLSENFAKNGISSLTHIAVKNAKNEIILLITPVFINKSKLAKLLSVNYQSNTNWLFG